MSYAVLGQTPPAQTRDAFADVILIGGIVGGAALAIVGGVVGQHRLWTRHILRRNRRRWRRR